MRVTALHVPLFLCCIQLFTAAGSLRSHVVRPFVDPFLYSLLNALPGLAWLCYVAIQPKRANRERPEIKQLGYKHRLAILVTDDENN